MLKAPAIREKVFEMFKKKILPVLHANDQLLVSGFDESGFLFYILTNQALFVFEGRWETKIANEKALESFYYGATMKPKKMVVAEILDDLVKVYQTNGSHTLQHHHAQISACFIFPRITKDSTSKEIGLFRNKIYKSPFRLSSRAPALQESLQELIETKLEELKQIQENTCLGIVKELLLELRPGDEVGLQKAIEVVQKEGNFKFINDGFIEQTLRKVAEEFPVFEYVRLKDCIRMKDGEVTRLSEELDATFTAWSVSVKEGKEKCMVCMGILVAGEEIAACEHCGSVAHKEHLQEWLRQKGVCPVCKEQLDEKNIMIKGKKK